MSDTRIAAAGHALAPRRAALIAGLAYLLTPTPFAEFYAWPKLVISGDPASTVRNIAAHQDLFAFCIAAYLVSYILDVTIAWALYYVLKPVSAPVSRLAAWFQLVYSAVGLSASLGLVRVLRLLRSPEDMALLGDGSVRAQVRLELAGFHPVWGLGLVFFGVHLLLVGFVLVRSGYGFGRAAGAFSMVAGAAYVAVNLNACLFDGVDLGFLGVGMLGELVLVFWLLVWGWRGRRDRPARAEHVVGP